MEGGAGNDVMEGGADADTFLFALGFGEDTISNWEAGDKISLNADLAASFDALDDADNDVLDDADDLVAISGGDTVIDFGGGDVLTIDATTDLASDDFLFV